MDDVKFEEGFKRLDEIIKKLEDPKTPLEDSFLMYKDAMELTGYLKEKIENMEKEIKLIAQENKDED